MNNDVKDIRDINMNAFRLMKEELNRLQQENAKLKELNRKLSAKCVDQDSGYAADLFGKKEEVKKPRERNELIDTILAVSGSNPFACTKPQFSTAAKALSLIRGASPEVTCDILKERAQNFKDNFGFMTLTPMALAKYWGGCEKPNVGGTNGRRGTTTEQIANDRNRFVTGRSADQEAADEIAFQERQRAWRAKHHVSEQSV